MRTACKSNRASTVVLAGTRSAGWNGVMTPMKRIPMALLLVALAGGGTSFAGGRGTGDTSKSPHARLRSLPMEDVKLTEGFWADRFVLCQSSMLPALHRTLLEPKCPAQLNRIKFMAGLHDENPGGVDWADGDCYKWIEAMAHVYGVTKDEKLDRLMDEWIAIIGKAQDEDGYISSSIGHDKSQRLLMPYRHECYNMGHLLTAASVHHRITGKNSFLLIAKKVADFLYREFKPNPPRLAHFPWNPSTYMGLVDIYRTTGNRKYLEVAEIMLDNRGARPGGDHKNGGTDQTQDRVPFRQETEAVGHAVCGMYAYCGAADIYAETGDAAILTALKRIWESVSLRKMDITGSVAMGAGKTSRGDPVHEAFGADYAQPNLYNETCASIGNAMFNWRMLLLTGEPKYADMMERVAYNCLNAAVDLKGENWFYCNPLSWRGTPGKGHLTGLRWHDNDCYCCPPSVARTTAQLRNWMYTTSNDGLWVHLYGGNELSTALADGSSVKLSQQTDYPWDGKVKLTVKEAGEKPFALYLRIPEWTENASLKVNGQAPPDALKPGSYAKIRRQWKAGDVIQLDLPMPIRLMEASPKVRKLRGKVAVMRGPLVYCLELPTSDDGGRVWKDGVFLPENIELIPEHRRGFLGGVTVLKGKALTEKGRMQFINDKPEAAVSKTTSGPDDPLYSPLTPRPLQQPAGETIELSLIPYYAWANRGLSFMEVWIPLAR